MKKTIVGFLVILLCLGLVSQVLAQEVPLPKKKAVQTSPPEPPQAPEAAPRPVPSPVPQAADPTVQPELQPARAPQPHTAGIAPEPARAAQPQPAETALEPAVPVEPRLSQAPPQPPAADTPQPAAPSARTGQTADRNASWQAAQSVLLRKEVIKVNYIDAGEAMQILNSYKSGRGRIQRQRNRNTLIIEDTPEFVDKLLSILEELDLRPLDLMFTVDVIMGSMQEEFGEPLSGSDALVKELKSLLKYKHFSRLDATMIKIQDNSRSAQRMGGQGIGLLLELEPRHIKDGKTDAFMVELSLRQTTKRIPFKQYSGGEEKILRYNSVDLEKSLILLQTSLSLKDGERSVVGVSKLNGGDTALILVIEGKVID